MFKLVILDLDGTLWDHWDASKLEPPFRLINRDTLVDRKGEKLRLYPGVRTFLYSLRKCRLKVTVASWNKPSIILPILDILDLMRFLNFYIIEYHDRKDLMIRKIINWYERECEEIKPSEIVYIDDRDIHIKQIRENIGEVFFIMIWRDVRGYNEILEILGCVE